MAAGDAGEVRTDGLDARVVWVFLDGVGIGGADPDVNPFLRAELPTLRRLAGGIPTLETPHGTGAATASVLALDATLGIEGVPQSGTGQTTLLTGRNAAELHGRHFGPWTPAKLRPLLIQENVLARALARGRTAVFANAYPRGFAAGRGAKRVAPSPLAAMSSGLMTRHLEDLAAGRAVASEITHRGWRTRLGHDDLPRITPEEAGGNLARIAAGADLTYFAHYSTDHAGHRGGMAGAIRALERVDRFLDGLSRSLTPDTVVLVASDHGNIEQVGGGHTRNPVLGLAFGAPAHRAFDAMSSIAELAPAVLGLIGAAD